MTVQAKRSFAKCLRTCRGTVDVLPGILLAATVPVGIVLGKQLRMALALPAEQLPTLR
jgi:hypothetical protein